MLRMEAGEPLAYAKVTDSNIYIKCGQYISQALIAYLFTFLSSFHNIDPYLSVIMLTGFGALETAQEALRLGANDYINKPFDAAKMREVISRNVERTVAHRKSVEAAQEIKDLNQRLMGELAQKEHLASLGQASAE